MDPQELLNNYAKLFGGFQGNLTSALYQGMYKNALQKAGRGSGAAISSRVQERINQMAHQAAMQAAQNSAMYGGQRGGGGAPTIIGSPNGELGGILGKAHDDAWKDWLNAPARDAERAAKIAEARKMEWEANKWERAKIAKERLRATRAMGVDPSTGRPLVNPDGTLVNPSLAETNPELAKYQQDIQARNKSLAEMTGGAMQFRGSDSAGWGTPTQQNVSSAPTSGNYQGTAPAQSSSTPQYSSDLINWMMNHQQMSPATTNPIYNEWYNYTMQQRGQAPPTPAGSSSGGEDDESAYNPSRGQQNMAYGNYSYPQQSAYSPTPGGYGQLASYGGSSNYSSLPSYS